MEFFLVVGRDASGDKRKVSKCAAGNKFFGYLFQNYGFYNCRHLPLSSAFLLNEVCFFFFRITWLLKVELVTLCVISHSVEPYSILVLRFLKYFPSI